MDIHKLIDEALAAREQSGHEAGVKAGRAEIADEVNDLINKERAKLIDQGRAQGRAEVEPLIEKAREEGRLVGVEDGLTQAALTNDKKITDKARKEGHQEGRREGYKAGRGEGYKAGWNDAIATPVRDQKAK